MKLDRGMAVILLGVVTVVASGWCWTTAPEAPYVAGVEMAPCTGVCTPFYWVCQQGDVCATAWSGAETCSDWMANRPVEKWTGGGPNAFGCCQGGSFVVIDTSRTCPTPLALPGLPGCILFQPAPQ